jgi:hypothetical protein
MELLYRAEGRLADPVVIGPVPGANRVDFYFEGRVTAGKLAGSRFWGVDYQTQREDGVGLFDARDTFEVDGGHVLAHAHGYVLLSDGGSARIHGYGLLETGVPELEHLNRAVVEVTGSVDMDTGELVFEGRASQPASVPLAA